jgi:5'-3' exonuclease
MQERTRLIVDVSSVLWTCLLVGKDTEFGHEVLFTPELTEEEKEAGKEAKEKKFWVNGAEFGFENVNNHLLSVLEKLDLAPMDIVLVVEGMNTKGMRQLFLPQYKEKRDRPEDSYVEFQKLREMVVKTWTSLGAIAVTQDGVEADDIIGYLCMKLGGKKIVDSNDGDICALISDGSTGTKDVSVWRQSKNQLVTDNPYGPFSCKHVTLYKAIVGDTGDKIPGAKGFGGKTWLDFLCNYDEAAMDVFVELIVTKNLDRLAEDVAEFKPLQKVLDNKDMVYKSWACARLYPEMINTVRKPLQWSPGMVRPASEFRDERLRKWAGQVRLVHAGNFKAATEWMRGLLQESPFISFDIETSANDTAEQWLETAKTKSNESKDAESVDVFGAELASFSLTFGRNMQYTLFFTVAHVETDKIKNITKDQAKSVLEMLPKSKIKAIQNVSFELPIVYNELGPLQEAA